MNFFFFSIETIITTITNPQPNSTNKNKIKQQQFFSLIHLKIIYIFCFIILFFLLFNLQSIQHFNLCVSWVSSYNYYWIFPHSLFILLVIFFKCNFMTVFVNLLLNFHLNASNALGSVVLVMKICFIFNTIS